MHKSYLYYLKKPCQNRGLSLEIENDLPIIEGKKFDTYMECEKFLESIPRIDIPKKEDFRLKKIEIREYLMDRIEGILGSLNTLHRLDTIDLLKIYIHLTGDQK